MRLVDLNYNFECDWLTELLANKLSDNNLASGINEKISFKTNHNRGWLVKIKNLIHQSHLRNCNGYD